MSTVKQSYNDTGKFLDRLDKKFSNLVLSNARKTGSRTKKTITLLGGSYKTL